MTSKKYIKRYKEEGYQLRQTLFKEAETFLAQMKDYARGSPIRKNIEGSFLSKVWRLVGGVDLRAMVPLTEVLRVKTLFLEYKEQGGGRHYLYSAVQAEINSRSKKGGVTCWSETCGHGRGEPEQQVVGMLIENPRETTGVSLIVEGPYVHDSRFSHKMGRPISLASVTSDAYSEEDEEEDREQNGKRGVG